MKKQLLLLVMMLLSMVAMADPVEIDGIYYSLISKGNEAIVTSNPNKYAGDITIPASISYGGNNYNVTTIGYYAFKGCSDLTSTTIPNSVTDIGYQSFANCSSLSSISIPNSVKTLNSAAFWGCSNLETVSIGSGLETIDGSSPFGACDKLVSIVVDKNNPKYDSRNNCNAIIEKESNKLIVGCKGTTIPNSVICIGDYSFQACYGLTSMDIPQCVTTIEYGAFYGCRDLANVSVPNSVIAVGGNAFYGTPWFDNQPDGLLYVGKVAYKYKGTMPDGTTINIKDGTVGITANAFEDCSGLVSVTVPNSVMDIGDNAFTNCTGLTSIDISEGVTSIGQFAFWNCSGLLSIDIPEGVTSIGQNAFEGCSSLSSITFPGSLKTIDGYLFGYNGGGESLTSITVGEGVENIGKVFHHLKNATITLPNSVTSISSQAFTGCQNCTVTIGSGIRILNDAFYNTYGMTINIHAFNRPETSYHCFYFATNCKSYVPYGRGGAYEAGRSSEGGYWWCGNITEMPYPSLTIGSSGYATYCSDKALDFSGVEDVKAYVATEYNVSTNTLLLTRVMKTSAGEGIIVVGKPGTYDIPECTTDITYTNLLKGMSYPGYVEPTDGDYTNFLFTDSNAETSFHPMEDTTPFFAGTAYLHLPSNCLPTDKIIVKIANGDMNGDGIINGIDLVAQTNLIMTDQYDAAADLNNDGVVNGLDYVMMVNLIMSFTSAPAMEARAGNRAASIAGLSIEDFDIKAGETKEMYINLSNPDTELTLLQFDMSLPEGLSIATEDGDYAIDIAGRTTWKKHSLMAKGIDGATRFLLASNSNALIDGDNGNVISIKLTASSGFNGGDIKLENQLLVSPDAKDMMPADYIYAVGDATSIDAVTAGEPVDVYTLTGSKVRHQATSLDGLPKGAYIIKGKKVIVK